MQNHLPPGSSPGGFAFSTAAFCGTVACAGFSALAGHDLVPGWPRAEDGVVVWGQSPYAARGEAVAARCGVPVVRIEDALLRSVRPGRAGDAPLGLLIDPFGVHFDGRGLSVIEHHLMTNLLDDFEPFGPCQGRNGTDPGQ